MEFKNMRDYSREEFAELVSNLSEEDILRLANNYGGFPVLFRMSLNEKLAHIPFIQPGASIFIRDEDGRILLEERTDRNLWCIPGGCQDLGESLEETIIRETYEETGLLFSVDELTLIGTASGKVRRNYYPNGDIVYNNSNLYLVDVTREQIQNMRVNSESKRLEFFHVSDFPDNLMDKVFTDIYVRYIEKGIVR